MGYRRMKLSRIISTTVFGLMLAAYAAISVYRSWEEGRERREYQAFIDADRQAQKYLDSVDVGEKSKADSIISIFNNGDYSGITHSKAVRALSLTRSPKAYEPLLRVAGTASPFLYSHITYTSGNWSLDIYDDATTAIKGLVRISGRRALKHFIREYKKGQPDSDPYVISRFILEGINPEEEKDYVVAILSKPLLDLPTKCNEIVYAKALRKVDDKTAEIVSDEIDNWKDYYRHNDCAEDIIAALYGQEDKKHK